MKETLNSSEKDPWDNPDVLINVGVMHEKPSFPTHMTCLEFLERVAEIYGEGKSRTKEVLETVGLANSTNRRIGALSAGMLQRLSVAQAMLHNPQLIIADEPAANLDPAGRLELLNLISKLHHEEKVDFLISSHIIPELARVCEEVAIIDNGRIRIRGKLSELFKKLGPLTYRVTVSYSSKILDDLSKLPYVFNIQLEGPDILLNIENGYENQFYSDLSKIADQKRVKIIGVESRSTTLEQLFMRVIKRGEMIEKKKSISDTPRD